MNTSALDKIHQRYNPEHDLGPDAPIHWSVEELANLFGELIEKVIEQEKQIAALLAAMPSAGKKAQS